MTDARRKELQDALAILGKLEVEPMREGDKFTWIKPAIAGTAGRMRPEIANAIITLASHAAEALDASTKAGVYAVFDADGCECKSLEGVFSTEEKALRFARRYEASLNPRWRLDTASVKVEPLMVDEEREIFDEMAISSEIEREAATGTVEGPQR